MADENIKGKVPHKQRHSYLLCIALLLTMLIIGACSSQFASASESSSVPTAQPLVTNTPLRPTLLPAKSLPSSTLETNTPAAQSYHAVLMLERSTDLILTVIEQISAGKIAPDDTSTISAYTNAFPVAVDAFNQSTPPMEFEDIWTQVYMAVQQYNQAYMMLASQIPVSAKNVGYLKETRQLLMIDQQMVEKYLSQSGLGADFISAAQQAVDQHLQQAYGDRPVPTPLP